MENYQDLKKLDEESLQQLREGSGPSDKCICNLLSPERKKSFGTSLKKALGITKKSVGIVKKDAGIAKKDANKAVPGSILIPLNKGGGKGLQSTKEVVKRTSSCGKCGCDDNQMVLRHSYANIRITSPDLSSVCPCPSDCLPDKERLKNNIKVIVEHAQLQSQPMLSNQSAESLSRSESNSMDRSMDASVEN